LRIAVLAVGRLKAGPEHALAEDYRSRAQALGRPAGLAALTIRDFAESRAQTAALRSAEEARLLLAAIPARAVRVVLDEHGKALSSLEFAHFLRRELEAGSGELAFLVGGPDGHGAEALETARLVLSLGPMTWPHRLVRVLVMEQIYRAFSLLVNHPYHRA
jgi:23S rRNA (pseudouridine1915-N3)-methyltransferase